MRYLLCIFLFGLLLTACQETKPDPNNTKDSDPKPILFDLKEKKIAKSAGNCQESPTACGEVQISYFQAEGGQEELRNTMNNTIEVSILERIRLATGTKEMAKTLEVAADSFLQDYEEFKTEMGEDVSGWMLDIKGTISHRSEEVISMHIETYHFIGGAYPNIMVDYLNFNAKNGRELTPDDFIDDKAALLTMAEEEFRKAWKLEPESDLGEEGFEFPENKFTLPKNFGFSDKGLVLFYNTYEIAPRVTGPTDLLLPYDRLEKIINRH